MDNDRKSRYYAYINSEEWKNAKIDILVKRGCKCERCKRTLPPNVLELHHRTYARLFNEKESDLELLCPNCHHKEHHAKKKRTSFIKKKRAPKNKKNHVAIVEKKIRMGVFRSEKEKLNAMIVAFKNDTGKTYKP